MTARGRGEGTPVLRRRILLGTWLLACCGVVARAAQLQVAEGGVWREAALQQQSTSQDVPAPRGTIVDRNGVVLAMSRETYRVGVAPRELADRDADRALLARTLDLSDREARRLTDPGRKWAMVPGTFPPEVHAALAGVRGVYLERRLERFYPHGDLARGVLGAVVDGQGRGGIEQAFDDLLKGTPGRQVLARDSRGEPIPGEVLLVEPPVGGGQVRLTVDIDLQEIARQALEEAVKRTGARGGDVVVTDPSTGEVLALVSMKDGDTGALSAINAPYEPGSTLKPFTVAALLSRGLVSLADSVDVGNGTWTVAGRTLHDVDTHGVLTVAEALRHSSNVGMAKVAQALTPGEQYQNLRDFGFGTETGIELPGEQAGVLRRPRRWSLQSPASLAIGYEIGVTPLQMAMAYGALANGGELMEARLVRELDDPDGGVVEQRPPRAIRRVVPRGVARQVDDVLVQVVEDGTGTAARLGTFQVAGKTGTSRAYGENGYTRGDYFASFAGFFPAGDPQLVIFVKLHSPKGTYYGGSTAGPVTRATMEAALAARRTPLDRRALVEAERRVSPRSGDPARFASLAAEADPGQDDLPPGASSELLVPPPAGPVPVPEVAGLPPRAAVRRLHAMGLRVLWDGNGRVVGTSPGAGSRVAAGDTVRLRLERAGR